MSKIITPIFRGSFVNLFTPRTPPGAPEGASPKYQITIPLPKDDAFWEKLNARIDVVAKEKFGKIPPRLKRPVKDGNDLERPEFTDKYTVQATSLDRPGVVDKDMQAVIDPDEIYSGAHYRASIRCFAWEHPTGGKGVSVSLDNVMKVKDGEPFSGKSKAEDDFSEFATADEVDEDLLG